MKTRRLLTPSFALLASLLSVVVAQADSSTGSWAPGPAMSVGHDSQPAIVLKDGRILVLGTRPEVYDPTSNRWGPAGSPAIARTDQTATLLGDGRVLVVGGIDPATGLSVSRAELYDPKTNSWAQAASLVGRRYAHTATLLADGRVLVAGGTRATVVLDSVEIYDPKTNSWSPGQRLSVPRSNHTAARLRDGRLLIAGGDGPELLGTAELYDPAANQSTPTTPMVTARHGSWSSVLPDGRVLLVGGLAGNPPPPGPAAEWFNPVNETWTPAATSSQPVLGDGTAITALKDGRVLVCGGASPIYLAGALRTGFIYDPRQDRWSSVEPMNQGRAHQIAATIPDGRVLVAGGRDAVTNGTPFNTTEIFTPAVLQTASASAGGPGIPAAVSTAPASVLFAGAMGTLALIVLAASSVIWIFTRRRGI